MTATFDLSLYPLTNDYPEHVLAFIAKLRAWDDVEVHTTGLSTLLIGDYNKIWASLGELTKETFLATESVLIIKVAPGRREYSD